MIKLKRLNNNIQVKAIKTPAELDNRPWKGHRLFSRDDINLYLVARKRSGKTCTIFRILKEVCSKDTNIFVFCSTVDKDQNYLYMKKYFKKKGIQFITETSIFDENGGNQLEEILKDLAEQGKTENKDSDDDGEEEKDVNVKDLQACMFGTGETDKESKKKEDKFKHIEHVFIFDDLSTEIKNKVSQLLKTNRHYKAMVIISSQYTHDLEPQARKQIDQWLLYKGLKDDKLQIIYKDADLPIDYALFKELYSHATKEKFHFLNIDCRNDIYKKDFSFEYQITET